ncbi:hypothetical protein Tco_0853091 [Tanacetum coccineum]
MWPGSTEDIDSYSSGIEGVHPTFIEEFLNFQQQGHVLQLANFKDDSIPTGKVGTSHVALVHRANLKAGHVFGIAGVEHPKKASRLGSWGHKAASKNG